MIVLHEWIAKEDEPMNSPVKKIPVQSDAQDVGWRGVSDPEINPGAAPRYGIHPGVLRA